MPRQSKRTSAPAPMVIPTPPPPPPSSAHPVPPSGAPSMFGPGPWCPPYPPQSMAPSPTPYWIPGLQHPGTGSLPQGPGWAPASSANMEDSDLQVLGVDSTPPGGLLNFLNKNTPKHGPAQVVINGSSSQPINVGDDTRSDSPRIEKRMKWTKDEDIILVGAWINNSNDPIHANYKKNDQYWKEVTAAYNSAIPKNRARLMKCIKDRFGRIKKRVAWFCGSWKEANALWASGESDVDLMDRALKLYEVQHKKDGPFMFKHCWDVLRKEPKWDAYLERLENLDPEKRKYNLEDDVGQPIPVDDDKEERPIGGKKAKELQKRKRKDQACIDLEDELQLFLDAQNKANEGRNEINGNEYSTGYYLADGIYPEWAAFMKTIPVPQTQKHKVFAQHQEGARKDVERAFGVLQSRFTIIRRPARLWKRKSVGRIMLACVILHNMIVEDEKEEATIHIDLNESPGASFALPPEVNVGGNLCFADVLRRKAAIHSRPQHTQLKKDLIELIWNRFGNTRQN